MSDTTKAATPRRLREVDRFDLETDVAVIGFGSAGACAAIEAARAGARTLVLERGWRGGGTSAESTGQIYMGGGTPLQKACGFEDTPDEMYKYLVASCGPGADETKIRLYSDRSVEHYHWLTGHGVPFDMGFVDYQVSTMPEPGKSLSYTGSERAWPYREIAVPAPRGHTVQNAAGELLMQLLMKAAEDAGAGVQTDTRTETLVVDDDGRVVGVVARVGDAEQLVRARHGVVITTGGFVHNEDMMRWYAPGLMRCGRTIAAEGGDDGAGIRMGIGAGGAAIRMDAACIVLGFAYGNRKNIRGILVNTRGQRYVNEDVYQSNHGEIALNKQDGQVYLIVDDSIYEPVPTGMDEEIFTYKVAAVGETGEELERELGMPEKSLSHTLAMYNENAARGEDPTHHKESCWLQPLDKPPLAAIDLRVEQAPYSLFTLGGLRTQPTGEVLDTDGAIVRGLWAAGRSASGIPAYGYNSGLSLADCTFSGRMAGQAAAGTQP
ncbi:MAG: FAD-dependent oxidoreductase [Myxococcota bacterium]|nr:FAD-dependent oxidoreductase [Myxococcota bacterium]